MSGDLIDTTEMYLRVIFEVEEEGGVPMRARIVERLHQSGPTVSQTVARMERDGLVTVAADRRLELTEQGRAYATRVMRKHRLVERLLTDVIGLEWSLVHDEACRWEHVVSDDVERRLVTILGGPTHSPYGNPIPGLDELGVDVPAATDIDGGVALPEVASAPTQVEVRRLAEPLQADREAMEGLRRVGAVPGGVVDVEATSSGVLLRGHGSTTTLTDAQASHIQVQPCR